MYTRSWSGVRSNFFRFIIKPAWVKAWKAIWTFPSSESLLPATHSVLVQEIPGQEGLKTAWWWHFLLSLYSSMMYMRTNLWLRRRSRHNRLLLTLYQDSPLTLMTLTIQKKPCWPFLLWLPALCVNLWRPSPSPLIDWASDITTTTSSNTLSTTTTSILKSRVLLGSELLLPLDRSFCQPPFKKSVI